ncbi:MAG: hypothetical protein ABIK42_06795, partial [candidate division WOR-3 bacterium]
GSSGEVTLSFNTSYTVPNADKVDNYHAGNSSGQVPISNGTLCSNLNADMLDGYHASNLPVPSHSHSLTLSGDVTGSGNVPGTITTNIASGAVGTSELADEAVTIDKIANPLFTSEPFYIQRTSGCPTVSVRNTATSGDADVLYARALLSNSSSTWCLSSITQKGYALWVAKNADDNVYALYVDAYGSGSGAEGIYTDGRLVAEGGKSTVVRTSKGKEVLFCVESPEEEFYSNGTAQLSNGMASVTFDRLFSEAISPYIPVRVIITPVGSWSGIYVQNTTANGFIARCETGNMNAEFNWIAIGRRKGSEKRPVIPIPNDEEIEQMKEKKIQ